MQILANGCIKGAKWYKKRAPSEKVPLIISSSYRHLSTLCIATTTTNYCIDVRFLISAPIFLFASVTQSSYKNKGALSILKPSRRSSSYIIRNRITFVFHKHIQNILRLFEFQHQARNPQPNKSQKSVYLSLTNLQNPKPRLRYDFFLESLYRTLNTIVQNFLRFIFKPAILVRLDLV